MNQKIHRCFLISFLMIMSAVLFMFFLNSDVFAAEGEGTSIGRKIWDNIMLLINFGILVFLFIKFAKKPLMNFLHGERDKIAKDIDTIESQLKKARSLMEAEAEKLEKMDARLEDIKAKILEIGKLEKEKIIENAKINATRMIDDAEKEAQYSIITARDKFSHEMLDTAISITVERLIKGMSLEDNEKVVNQFTSNLSMYQNRI